MPSFWQPHVEIRPEYAARNAAQIALQVHEEEAQVALFRAVKVFTVSEAVATIALAMARAEAARSDYWELSGLDWEDACSRAAHLINHGYVPMTMHQLFETA